MFPAFYNVSSNFTPTISAHHLYLPDAKQGMGEEGQDEP
jgi:hypothetical protein